MKRIITAAALIIVAASAPAFAATQDKYAVGDMYTKALNMIESQGMLDLMNTPKHVPVTDIHIDHGQVFVTATQDGTSKTWVYDPIANQIVRGK